MAVLGPVRVCVGGVPVEVSAGRVRLLLARLALARGRVVTAEVLIEELWGGERLSDAVNTLQALVSRLRKVVGASAVELVGGGYRLAAAVDAERFEELAARGRRELGAGEVAAALVSVDAALGLWRGPALGDLADVGFVRAAAGRLAEARLRAVEDRFEAALRLGRHGDVLGELAGAVAEHPVRERLAALRIRALYEVGQQSEALAAYERVRAELGERFGVDPGAELRRVHVAMLRGELEPLLERPKPVPGRLPAQLTSFGGRDAELATLAGALAEARLVTVVGPGGVGKTRLAVEAAGRLDAHERGRVWFVPLAGAAGDVGGAVLGVLGAERVRPGGGKGLDQLVELIGPEAAVLVLDNCEHVVADAADFAGALLERLPLLTILATSREPLAITGEALCRLEPLGLPSGVAMAAESAAVRLFVERARAVRPGFALDETTAGPVVDICRRLDGLPLALELAAARLRAMPLTEIVSRLDDRFRLLASGSRTALPRHRTLAGVVEWSWELLTGPEQLLAARLSIFPGGATVAALEEVASDETVPVGEVVYVLGSLVEKSLVHWDGQRYRMLETIRSFAGERLDDAEGFGARFTRYFAAVAEEQEPRLRLAEQLDALRWFDTEYDNLVAALRAAIDGRVADVAARLVGAVQWYWHTMRFDARSDGFVAEVLDFGEALPDHSRAALALSWMLTDDTSAADPERLRSAIEDCVSTGALERYPTLLFLTAPMAYFMGQVELAERLLRGAEERSQPWSAGIAAWARSVFRADQGDWAGAAALRLRALRQYETAGDRVGLAFILGRVAQDHALRGEHDEAIAALQRCVVLAAEISSAEEISYRSRLGAQRSRAGDADGARRELDVALRQAIERGQPQLRIEPLVGLADLHRRAGEADRADALLAELETLVRGLAGAEQTAAAVIAPVRMALRLDTGDAKAAETLPVVAATGTLARDLAAPAAELLARLRFRDGDPEGAAVALGMSQVIRGVLDRGDPELRALTDALVARLGADGYAAAFQRGAELPRDEALRRVGTF
ncbi:transcriptional regulator, winged helix family [Stackebrandtia nassauensis DSM 44728]|uniref:Transcriptional regulator, winged helix family n=1 Tax=Stackebrandtia nassauensis (strain DSM 44728 / CIP 108903 / NRRL B-16338 / NBRC 102104 / LLR-40K-21) TaxID=446470 RepID=D3Q4M1_STANL|nr:transcriptional regulator, winged helix family [Stackebrandtia nassauensis DSM 44728]